MLCLFQSAFCCPWQSPHCSCWDGNVPAKPTLGMPAEEVVGAGTRAGRSLAPAPSSDPQGPVTEQRDLWSSSLWL